ncbi:MAG: DUF1697 domain-containing protein [Coriobacteriales bacterium]|jgi:uncharacterized protein (DUF1697 family)|nr:DUF1697 domain-containing protein [Coriobacteriales bacterium]
MRYLALLRGVNVGGKNKIAMPALKAAFESQGFKDVVTYINSGNILFETLLDEAEARSLCEDLLKREFDLSIPVGIITAPELAKSSSAARNALHQQRKNA